MVNLGMHVCVLYVCGGIILRIGVCPGSMTGLLLESVPQIPFLGTCMVYACMVISLLGFIACLGACACVVLHSGTRNPLKGLSFVNRIMAWCNHQLRAYHLAHAISEA